MQMGLENAQPEVVTTIAIEFSSLSCLRNRVGLQGRFWEKIEEVLEKDEIRLAGGKKEDSPHFLRRIFRG